MGAPQNEAIAYGRPDFGGIVFGGENAGAFTLAENWTEQRDGPKYIATGGVWVHGVSGGTEIETRIAALDAWNQERGTFAITAGRAFTVDADLTVAAPDIFITATATSPFLPIHVGLPISFEGVGSFVISEVLAGNQVRCRIPDPLPMPPATAGGKAYIGRVVRYLNEDTKQGGFNALGQVGHANDSKNEPNRRLYTWRIEMDRPAREYRPPDEFLTTTPPAENDRDITEVSFMAPVGGRRVVRFRGKFTAANGQDALDRYNAQILGFVADTMERLLGINASFETPAESPDALRFDDRRNILEFEIVRQEINFKEALDAVKNDHPAISNADIDMTITHEYQHGLVGENTPAVVGITYGAVIPRNAIPDDDVQRLWIETIYPFLVATAEEFYQSPLIVVSNNGARQNPVTKRISGSIVAVLPSLGSTITNYNRKVRYRLNHRKKYRERNDGRDFSAVRSSIGPLIQAVVTTQYTELESTGKGSRAKSRDPFGGVFGMGGPLVDQEALAGQFGIFGIDKKLHITFGEDGGGGGDGEDIGNSLTRYDPTGDPIGADVFFAQKPFSRNIAAAEWDEESMDVEVTANTFNDPHGVSASGVEVITTIVRVLRWVNLKAVSSREGAGGRIATGTSGDSTKTVERNPNPNV